MLRSRKKDVRIKPNRKLDKRSSRGMLYENEELRLRTIEINAEVERGQTDIKKLRRENDHLRREMWALRDEYERLENLIKHLDLAGTSQSGGSGTGAEGGDDDEATDRDSPSGADRDADDDDNEPRYGRTSSLSLNDESTLPAQRAASVSAARRACQGCDDGGGGQVALYVECGRNADLDNLANYQKAYGRMPRRCSSAGARVYADTWATSGSAPAPFCSIHCHHVHQHLPHQHHLHPPPHAAGDAAQHLDSASASASTADFRSCYESITPMLLAAASATSASITNLSGDRRRCDADDDEEPPYASPAGSHIMSRYFGRPGISALTSATAVAASVAGGSCFPPPPPLPPPPPPPPLPPGQRSVHAFPAPPSVRASLSRKVSVGGADGGAAAADGDEGHFNLDHLVSIVRSFRQEQQLHQQQQQQEPPPSSPPSPTSPPTPPPPPPPSLSSASVMIMDRGGAEAQLLHSPAVLHNSHAADAAPISVATAAVTINDVIVEVPTPPSTCSSSVTSGSRASSPPEMSSAASAALSAAIKGQRMAAGRRTEHAKTSSGGDALAVTLPVVPVAALVGVGAHNGAATQQSVTFTQSTSNHNGHVTKQSVTFRQNSIVFVNPPASTPTPAPTPAPASAQVRNRPHLPLQLTHCDTDALVEGGAVLDPASMSLVASRAADARSLLRLHSVDPNTVCFDLSAHAALAARNIGVQDIIDELDSQLDAKLCVVRGVRLVGALVYVSLDKRSSMNHLLSRKTPLAIFGVPVHLTDVSRNTLIVVLIGVPHYISDVTVAMLLAAFGVVIGDLERRFYKGVDTGERLVRLKVKSNVKIPRHITVGGCRIQVRVLHPVDDQPVTSAAAATAAAAAAAAAASTSLSVSVSSPDVGVERQRHPTTLTLACDDPLDGGGSVGGGDRPKIGRSFEYRSQLSVNLRMSAELPIAAAAVISDAADDRGSRTPATPPCPICELHVQHPLASSQPCGLSKTGTGGGFFPPPPLPPAQSASSRNLHETLTPLCSAHHHRHHRCGSSPSVSDADRTPAPAAVSAGAGGGGRCFRESPPKSRASVNFEESASVLTSKSAKPAPMKGAASSASGNSNGILRKSVSGDTDAANMTAADEDLQSAASDLQSAAGKSKNTTAAASAATHRPLFVKKTTRSFSLVDTFRTRNLRKSAAARQDSCASAGDDEGLSSGGGGAAPLAGPSGTGGRASTSSINRRDSVKSTESGSRSSRSSRKSGELPWCGCWGNGCL